MKKTFTTPKLNSTATKPTIDSQAARVAVPSAGGFRVNVGGVHDPDDEGPSWIARDLSLDRTTKNQVRLIERTWSEGGAGGASAAALAARATRT